MSLNVIHGIFIGVFLATTAIHFNVYLGFCSSYFDCVTGYWIIGSIGYFLYWGKGKIHQKRKNKSKT